jgi:hypothetical protein
MTNHPENLSVVQAWMQQALIEPDTGKNTSLIDKYIAPSAQLTAKQSLAIYQRSYYSRLLECMREQFKALHYTLGNELFSQFALMYLEKYPSKSPCLSFLGSGFPGFLQDNRPDRELREPWVDFMIAMASFECDLYRIFDQPGSEGEIFADMQTPDAELQLQTCFQLRQYPFDVNNYYQEVTAGLDPVMKPEQNIYIAFVRNNYQVYIISINPFQFELLDLLKQGLPINKAISSLLQKSLYNPGPIKNKWKEWKKEWIKKGFFIKKPLSVY